MNNEQITNAAELDALPVGRTKARKANRAAATSRRKNR